MSISDDFSATAAKSPTVVNSSDTLLRSLIGSALLLLIADFAEPIFFGEGFYAALPLHPYWVIVILSAVQGGLYVGVAIAGLATLMMDWPIRPMGINITSHYIDTAILPLQWLIAALAIGVFRQGQLREEDRLRQDNARLIHISDQLSKEVLRLDEALARSELAVVTRPEDMTECHIGPMITYLARLANVSRQMLSDSSEPLPHHHIALLTENPDGNLDVATNGIEPWIAQGKIPETHPVAAVVKGLQGHAIVQTKEACFVCWSLPEHGAYPVYGALVTVLEDENRIADVKSWLSLLAPLVAVALAREDKQTALLKNPSFGTAARLPYLMKNNLN